MSETFFVEVFNFSVSSELPLVAKAYVAKAPAPTIRSPVKSPNKAFPIAFATFQAYVAIVLADVAVVCTTVAAVSMPFATAAPFEFTFDVASATLFAVVAIVSFIVAASFIACHLDLSYNIRMLSLFNILLTS